MVALRHMMSPLAGMKQNQNQNLEAYTRIDMQKYVENCWYGIISFKWHKNYKEFEWKSNKKSYFPVFPIFAKILSISQDGNYR